MSEQYMFEHGREKDAVVADLMEGDVPNAKDDFGDAVRIIYDEADMYVTDSFVELFYDEELSEWVLEGVKAMVRGEDVPFDTESLFDKPEGEGHTPLGEEVLGEYNLIDFDAYSTLHEP